MARVRKPQLVRLVQEWYAKETWEADPRYAPLFEQLQALRAFLETLDEEKEYGLVAWEL